MEDYRSVVLGFISSEGEVLSFHLHGQASEVEDFMEKATDVECSEGEFLLGCHENDTWYVDHDRCWGKFDSAGSFHCPACSFEQVVIELEPKKLVSVARQALLKFSNASEEDDQELEFEDQEQPSPLTTEGEVCHLAQAGKSQEKEDLVMCKMMASPDNCVEGKCVTEHNPVLFLGEADSDGNCRKIMDHIVHPSTSLDSEKKENLDSEEMRTDPLECKCATSPNARCRIDCTDEEVEILKDEREEKV